MSILQSSLVVTRIVSERLFLQLCSVWYTTAEAIGENTILVTEERQSDSVQNYKKIHLNRQSELEKFCLLITPSFSALLQSKHKISNNKYQTKIVFDRQDIKAYLQKLSKYNRDNFSLIQDLQNNVTNKPNTHKERLQKFARKTLCLLTSEDNNSSYIAPKSVYPMEELLYRQTEQQQILNRLQIQIAKEIDLWQIIQTAIEDGCKLLQLDRLLIYQLDVSFDSYYTNSKLSQPADVVTYEAKSSRDILSTLYFQEESCFRSSGDCRHKYHQGFSLAIDDVDNSNLPSCLRSLMQELQVKAKLIVPINVHGKLWGLTIAHQCFVPREWRSDEIQFLRRLSEQLAVAIEHNQSYQTLKQQKRFLEQQVKTQAQQIKNALISAQIAARSKHEFLGSMSHELRTPLTSVIGLSSTLLQTLTAKNSVSLPIEKQQQYLKIIQESGKHLLSLIDNILNFSEVESGNYLLNIEQISLGNLAQKVLQNLDREAKEKQIELNLELKISSEQDLFKGDREKLTAILLNLLDNGIKFTDSGGKVTLRIWRETERAIFQIEDTGVGIAQKEIPLLFEKFKQLEDFRRRTHGGTGLGLALTKQLIELHSGTIEVRSTPKKGSIFTVYLPERNSHRSGKNTVEHISTHFAKEVGRKEVNKIVLITENEANATAICQLLTAIGYKVIWLIDSTMAIERIELLEPKIVIIDKQNLEVIEILSRNRQRHDGDRIKSLLWCSQITASEWQYFSENGVDDYLLETTNSLQIVEKIESLSTSKV